MLQAETLFLLLTGGEVFLYPGFLDLYDKLFDMGFQIKINTNGTMIDEAAADRLAQRPPTCVSLSLYGASDETYECLCGRAGMFTRVDRTVSLLQERHIAVECKTVLTPANAGDLKALWDYVKARDIFYETANYCFPPARRTDGIGPFRMTPEEAAELRIRENTMLYDPEANRGAAREMLEKYARTCEKPGHDVSGFSCSAANTACWITWQGRMTGCGMLSEPYTEPLKTGFIPAWEELKQKYDAVRQCSECAHCDKRDVCGACPASNYAENGCYGEPARYHCRLTDAFLRGMRGIAEEEET